MLTMEKFPPWDPCSIWITLDIEQYLKYSGYRLLADRIILFLSDCYGIGLLLYFKFVGWGIIKQPGERFRKAECFKAGSHIPQY